MAKDTKGKAEGGDSSAGTKPDQNGMGWGDFLPFFEIWQNGTKKFFQDNIKFSEGHPFKWSFENMVLGNDLYMNFFRLWADAMASIGEGEKGFQNDKDYMKKFGNMFNGLFRNFVDFAFPGNISSMFDNSGGFLKSGFDGLGSISGDWQSFFKRFSDPVIDSMQESFRRTADLLFGRSGPEDYKDYLSSCYKTHRESLGRILQVPMMGPSRQILEKFEKGVEAYKRMEGAWRDFGIILYRPWSEALDRVAERVSRITGGNLKKESFREIYDFWLETSVKTFDNVFRSEGFAYSLNVLMENSLDFWKRYQDILEEYYKFMPVPTRTDMDDVYRELYTLKKKVRSQEKEINALKEKLEGRKG